MFLDRILSYVAPHECLGCQAEGSLLCTGCRLMLPTVPPRCYRCHALSAGYRTCEACRRSSALYAVAARTVHQGAAKQLVWKLKFEGAQAAAKDMAALLAPLLDTESRLLIVPVPTATSRRRQRGYDQAVLLARAVAVRTHLAYVPALSRMGQHHQVGANRQQRVTQLQGAYHCVRPGSVRGRHVVLIDDVVTTGATLEAAAKALKEAGALRVSALVFTRALLDQA